MPILVDPDTGNKFDVGTEQGHVHRDAKAAFIPGQYSNAQVAEMLKNEPKGYCESCKHTFEIFHDAWVHMLTAEGSHPVHSVKR